MSRRTAIRGKLIARAVVTGLAASLAVVTAASATAHALPPDPPNPWPSGGVNAGVDVTHGCLTSFMIVHRAAADEAAL